MAHGVEEWLHALQQVMPRGKAWPREFNAVLTRFLRAFAHRLNDAEVNADLLLAEMRPETTTQLLTDWEEYLGLPECNAPQGTLEERRRAASEKHHRRGSLSPWQIEEMAQALGVSIKVFMLPPHHCLRDCMYPLYPPRYRWLIMVEAQEENRHLECVLSKYRLAGYAYDFIYP